MKTNGNMTKFTNNVKHTEIYVCRGNIKLRDKLFPDDF